MKVKVLEGYKDLLLDRYVEVGEVLDISPIRYKDFTDKELKIGRKLVEEIKEKTKEKTKEKKVEKKKVTPSEK
ncbi:hypothetical protein ABGF26_02645 [Helcococcus ovis]|uniref:hypothetical protein n=1 Tax=Helcococcus ovis TaxID=72026 RepID=UPI0038BB9F40